MDRRRFLLSAAAWTAASEASARPFLHGEARRISPDGVGLSWSSPGATSLYVSSDPDARRRDMRAIGERIRGGRAEVRAVVSPRPYFLLRTVEGDEVRLAERLLPLQGGRNFRDLGGYRGAGGRQVRWGRIYRSAVMSGLTASDLDYLAKLGIRVVCDLRTTGERKAEPTPWSRSAGPTIVATDYDMPSFAALAKVATRNEAIDAFADSYLTFAEGLAPQYTDMFARLVAGEAPLAFNCSAGKDRTGIAAAMILSVLGASRETVIADYALTQVYTPPSVFMERIARSGALAGVSAENSGAIFRIPREVAEVMAGSDPEIMRRTLAAIDQRYGGPVGMAKARFGLTSGKIAELRRRYLV